MSRQRGLPRFEGHTVAGARLKLNGLGEDLNESLAIGDRVYLCIEAEVKAVEHEQEAKGKTFIRLHKGVILRTGLMDPTEASMLLEAEAERRGIERAEAEAAGALPFPTGGRSGKDAAAAAGDED